MNILVTGGAGFIGYHLCRRWLDAGLKVAALDNLNDYYSTSLKKDRIEELSGYKDFQFILGDLADKETVNSIFSDSKFTHVVNLAAQAGVRYSLLNPSSYIQSNLVGFANLLEACRSAQVEHLVYASSSSVYGLNSKMPFTTQDNVDHPISLYAATKKSNELMAHSYSYLYALPTTGLRFFTVYGPWGRPDMALFIFTKAILEGRPIQLFNYGQLQRDFTYIDDITEATQKILCQPPLAYDLWNPLNSEPASSCSPYRVSKLGNNVPIPLADFVGTLEEVLGLKATIEYMPMQDGDVAATFADISPLAQEIGFNPKTALDSGIREFVRWYKNYYTKD